MNWGLFVIGSAYCIASIVGLTDYSTSNGVVPGDAYNYWQGLAYTDEHYRYSPAFLWATAPLRWLPVEGFLVIWTAFHLIAIAWLSPWLIVIAFDDVIRGNINTFLAVGIVLAVRGHAWTWALTLLTKVTPGVGLLYHVGRREWSAAGVAVGATLLIAIAGAIIDVDLWAAWVTSLRAGTENYQTVDVLAPLPLRLAVGAILCLAAARWIWLLPVGMILAMPGLWPSSLAMLLALPRLREATRKERRPTSESPDVPATTDQ